MNEVKVEERAKVEIPEEKERELEKLANSLSAREKQITKDELYNASKLKETIELSEKFNKYEQDIREHLNIRELEVLKREIEVKSSLKELSSKALVADSLILMVKC